MNQPLISVIIPIYKVEDYLEKCIQSILNQTYTNLEVWLVDDGSPDKCGEICDNFAKVDSRIRVIHKENGGLSDARNVALDVANGEWVTLIDSDDFVSSDYIEYLLKIATDNSCQCSIVQPQEFYEGQDPSEDSEKKSFVTLSSEEAISAMFYQTLFDTSAWGKLYHKSLFSSGIRYPKGLLFEDNPTTYQLLNKCEKIAVSQSKCYYYLIRKNSIQGMDFTPEKLDQGLQVLSLMQLHPEITDKLKSAFECKMASLAFHFIMKMPTNYKNKDKLISYIKKHRWKVIWDPKARFKTRIGCALSFLGIPIMKKIFNIVSKR